MWKYLWKVGAKHQMHVKNKLSTGLSKDIHMKLWIKKDILRTLCNVILNISDCTFKL